MKLKPLPFPKLPHDLSKVPAPRVEMLDANFDAIQANLDVMAENMAGMVAALVKPKGKK